MGIIRDFDFEVVEDNFTRLRRLDEFISGVLSGYIRLCLSSSEDTDFSVGRFELSEDESEQVVAILEKIIVDVERAIESDCRKIIDAIDDDRAEIPQSRADKAEDGFQAGGDK